MAVTKNQSLGCINLWAEWANISPLEWNCIDIDKCTDCPEVDFYDDGCKYWSQWGWQSRLARETVAKCMCSAIEQVQAYLETFIEPTWVCGERIDFPKCYTRTGCIDNFNWRDVKVKTKYKNIMDVGQQENEVIANPQVEYIDEDGDGWCETAIIEYELPEGVDTCDLSYYMVDDQRVIDLCKKVCPIRCQTFNSDTRIMRVEIDAELLVNPELYMVRKLSTPERTIDGCDKDNFVTHLAVLKETVSDCKPQALAYYYQDKNCQKIGCPLVCYPLCVQVDDACEGWIHFEPMNWDENEECVVDDTCGCHSYWNCRPEYVEVFYRSGIPDCTNCSSGRCSGSCCLIWEQVYKLTAACLPKSFCDCKGLSDRISYMQHNPQMSFKNDGIAWNIPFNDRAYNPFGNSSLAAIEAFQHLREYKWNMC